ncbi:hypothetical protein [Ferrovibrio sp.]|uniref:hypothetical protein n=1 Tax=Ferrovibrio sp. TaxID=1917215 RepID=UPI0035B3AE43
MTEYFAHDNVFETTDSTGPTNFILNGLEQGGRTLESASGGVAQKVLLCIRPQAEDGRFETAYFNFTPPNQIAMIGQPIESSEDGNAAITWGTERKNVFSVVPFHLVDRINDIIPCSVGGTANALSLTSKVPVVELKAGQWFLFTPTAPNTGAATAAISGADPVPIQMAGAALQGDELSNKSPELGYFDGAALQIAKRLKAGLFVQQGKFTFQVAAGGMQQSSTDGATPVYVELATYKLNSAFLSFPDAATKYAVWLFSMPKMWKHDTPIEIEVEFYNPTAAGVVRWGAEAVCIAPGASMDQAWGALVTAEKNPGAALVFDRTAKMDVTPANAGEGRLLAVRIRREGGHANDTLNAAAILVGCRVTITTNKANDG